MLDWRSRTALLRGNGGAARLLALAALLISPAHAQAQTVHAPSRGETQPNVGMSANTLTNEERASGWRLLFDGKTLNGWRGLGYDSVPAAHWKVEHGAIKKIASGNVAKMPDGQPANGGDLMTEATFGDFELSWEWKATPGMNSGVKYNVSEQFSLANASNHAALGFEYQLLDDSLHEDNKLANHRAGALYDLIAPNDQKRLRPVGEWNQSRLIFRGLHGEHWLNGATVVAFDLVHRGWIPCSRAASMRLSRDSPIGGWGTSSCRIMATRCTSAVSSSGYFLLARPDGGCRAPSRRCCAVGCPFVVMRASWALTVA